MNQGTDIISMGITVIGTGCFTTGSISTRWTDVTPVSAGITMTGGASGFFSSGGRTTLLFDDGGVTMTGGCFGVAIVSSIMRKVAAIEPVTATAVCG